LVSIEELGEDPLFVLELVFGFDIHIRRHKLNADFSFLVPKRFCESSACFLKRS